MANETLKQYGTRVPTPQSQPIPGRKMVQNEAGGHVFGVDKWARLHRWLILGSEGGTYYATERKLTFDNLDSLRACIEEDGLRTVSIITEISQAGRAPKNDPAIFALAMASAADDEKVRRAAIDAIPLVCRTGTHLFQYVGFVEQFRKWSRMLRSGVARWYTDMEAGKLALQLVKYRQREGWTHRDVLRKAHSTGDASPAHKALIDWTVHGTLNSNGGRIVDTTNDHLRLILGFQKASEASTAKEVAQIVADYHLPWEAVPPQFVNDLEVRAALLEGMPIGALVRQLGLLTSIDLLTPTSSYTQQVIDKLANTDAVQRSRIHPVNVLIALKTYEHGRGQRRTWTPLPKVVDALDDLFYAAFGNVEATGKRRCIALDVSGSMSGSAQGFSDVPGIPGLSPRAAAAAMSMVSMKTGDPYEVVAFTSGRSSYQRSYYSQYKEVPEAIPGLSVLPFSPRQRLGDIYDETERIFPGGTDAALPMVYAREKRREFDVFEVYTDNETWAGSIHPSQALAQYRQSSGIDAKLVVVAMTSTGYSIADPKDPGMLDVVGFDSATPNIISAFVDGEV